MLLFLSSLVVSTISSMVGLGGGVFFVPLLVLLFSFPIREAIGTSVFAMTLSTLSASLIYGRQGKIDYRIGLLLDSLDLPGVLLGTYLTALLLPQLLGLLFGGLVIFLSALMLSELAHASLASSLGVLGLVVRRLRARLGLRPRRFWGLGFRTVSIALGTSFFSGLVAGMLGAGGGTLDASMMVLGLGMSTHVASATSVFGMLLTNGFAALLHFLLGNVPGYALPFGIGALIGGQIGPLISGHLKGKLLKRVLAIVLLFVGLRMIYLPLG
jgi:hypothetical protein